MNDLNKIIDNYNTISPCLSKIKNNVKFFKNNNHPFIFSFLIGYFTKYNININDMIQIFNDYLNNKFYETDFFVDYKKLAYIFCNYYENKDLNSVWNNQSNIFNEHTNLINNDTSNNNINNINNSFSDIYNSNSNSNINNNINGNLNIANMNDYELAKQIEEQEKLMFQIKNNRDYELARQIEEEEIKNKQETLKQVKKCEICLEEFSLLDGTNYFLNCNCILHNKCFDDMVKSAIESNNLPIKCPNCGTQVHPNLVEDSIRNANPQLLSKYNKFSMSNFVSKNNDEYSSCPTPGCEYLFFFKPGEFNFLCPLCQKNYCLNCKDEWHVNLTCQQYRDSRDVNKLDAQFFNFAKGNKFKVCPKCKFWVEKNIGCNHMKCRCGADFCYLCGRIMNMSKPHICRI